MNLSTELAGLAQPGLLRPFVRFLGARRSLQRAGLPELLKTCANRDPRIGQLCLRKGWLDNSKIHRLLTLQGDRELRFGEAAVEAGLLTPGQVDGALKLQSNRFLLFLDTLLDFRVVVEDQIEGLLEEYREELRKHPEAAAPEKTPRRSSRPPTGAEIRAALRKVRSLGALPAVVQRVLALTEDADCGPGELTELLSADPNLSAQLLRIVNSAFVASARTISSLQQAVLRIGSAGVRVVALTAAALGQFHGGDKDRGRKIWRHSVLCSQWSRVLAEQAGLRPSEDAFVAGLVHDIGRAVIEREFPAAAGEIERLTFQGRTQEEAERERLGQTHADIGAYLADLWKFPLPIVEAIAQHHASHVELQASKGRPALVSIVNRACFLSGLPFQPYDEAQNRMMFEGLPPELRAQQGLDGRLLGFVPGIYEKAGALASWLA